MDTLIVYFILSSAQHQLPPNLLSSMCYVESKHNTKAIHKNDGKGDSVGICQIKLAAAQHVGFKGTQKELSNPKTNIHYAAKFLKYQMKRYHGNIARAVTAYNKGRSTGNGYSPYFKKVSFEMGTISSTIVKKGIPQ